MQRNSLTLKTPISDLHTFDIGKLSANMSKKLAASVAAVSARNSPRDATVEDLLNYFPTRYEDRSNFIGIDQLYDGLEASVELYTRVSGGFQVGRNRHPKQPRLYIFEISAGDRERVSKPVVVYWFVSGKQSAHVINYYKDRFDRMTRFVAFGRWEWDARRSTFALKVNKPDELEILPDVETGLFASVGDDEVNEDENLTQDIGNSEFATVHTNRHVPVYRKLGEFQTKRLREIVHDLISKLSAGAVVENLPPTLRKNQNLLSRREAVEQIHFPPDGISIAEYENFRSPSHMRLIFEEFFWVVFALQLKRSERHSEPKGTVIEITREFSNRVEKIVPFALTAAQKRVLQQISADLTSNSPMNRLLQGDVGSGKTIVALLAIFIALENGYQAALMAPTEILAEQHLRYAERIFAKTSYRVGLLTGSSKAADKRKMQTAIASGDIHLAIGTHALIQESVQFENLGIAVIDEQHRFGVLQRAELRSRGYNPDVLVMTATPIPRSLAMTVYGDLDVSIIDEMPPGRTPIKTVVVGEDQRPGVYKGIEREVSLGRQVYIVYPIIEESEKLDLKAATKMFEELRDKIFPDRRVGLIHGKMKPGEKEAVMRSFVEGTLDLLVSTTVIEVGVDIPNSSLMIIEHAERFGLSQLHQLRGRVGRGAEQSYCVLMTADKKTEVAKERLGIMEETNDGFKIAEKDLDIRGQGEVFGTRQSGIRTFRLANIVRDFHILEQAKIEADKYLTKKRDTDETRSLVKTIMSDPRFELTEVG